MILLVAMVRVNASDYIETLRRSQRLGLNLGLDGVYFRKTLILLLYKSNPNPYDFSSGFGEP